MKQEDENETAPEKKAFEVFFKELNQFIREHLRFPAKNENEDEDLYRWMCE